MSGRSNRLSTAVTPEEKSAVIETAKLMGLSPSEFVRRTSVSATKGMSPAERYLAGELADIKRMVSALVVRLEVKVNEA